MVTMTAKYVGGLSCTAVHDPSGHVIHTDAPVDIGGSARYFSPTDMIGAALLTCILTTVASVAEKYDIPVDGMDGSVEKIMTDSTPRRIAKFVINLNLPVADDHPLRDKLERAIHYCPVSHGLNPEIAKDIHVVWNG